MKKIVNGSRYDTEKATEVGSASSIEGTTDFRHWSATLYVTPRSKKFFLAGKGGPMTRFAQSTGQNTWSGGTDIIPMSRQEALEWAEEHLHFDEVESHFSDDIEDA